MLCSPIEFLRTEHLQVCVFACLLHVMVTPKIYTTDTISSFIMSTQKINEQCNPVCVCVCMHTQPWATMRLIIALHLLHRQSLVNTLIVSQGGRGGTSFEDRSQGVSLPLAFLGHLSLQNQRLPR